MRIRSLVWFLLVGLGAGGCAQSNSPFDEGERDGGGPDAWRWPGPGGGWTGGSTDTVAEGGPDARADGNWTRPVLPPVDGGPGVLSCDSNGLCCDGWGYCCFQGTDLCGGPELWGPLFGFPGLPDGGPRHDGGPDAQGPTTTDAGWDAPGSVAVEPPDADAPVWRQSRDPLCTEQQGWLSTHALWSDERGVFALVGGDGYVGIPFLGPYDGGTPGPGLTLWFNDGTGWAPYYEDDSGQFFYSEHQLAGVPGGVLFAYGYGDSFEGNGCGLATLEGQDSFECEPVYQTSGVSVVDADLAYAVADGSLIRWRDGRWGPYPGVLNDGAELDAVWADGTHIFASGQDPGQWLELRDGAWVVLDTGTLERFSALWGYAGDDVYAGTRQGGLYHYDGSTVREIEWPRQACPRAYPEGIRGIWGSGGVTYFYTSTQLAKLEGDSVEVVAEWPCEDDQGGEVPQITSLWGNGPDEVFIGLSDMRTPRQACGVAFVLLYDGKKLHRL